MARKIDKRRGKGSEEDNLMAYSDHRPKGCQGQGDSHLPRIAQRLLRVLSNTQSDFVYDSLRLGDDALGKLAGILVDFAEDLHNGIGIWATYERYNVEFVGTAGRRRTPKR